MTTQFVEVRDALRRAELIAALIKKAPFLNKEQLKQIAFHQWETKYLEGDWLSVNESFEINDIDEIDEIEIKVHNDPCEFGYVVTLQLRDLEHSWAGSSNLHQYGNWIIGEGSFGEKINRQYSLNGEMGSPEESFSPPNFSLKGLQAVMIKEIDYDSFNRNTTIKETRWTIHILKPDQPIKVDPAIAEIIEKFELGI